MSNIGGQRRQLLAKGALAVAAPIVFFGALELLLGLCGVEPSLKRKDPFVGFAGNVPLFVSEVSDGGEDWLVTSDGKLELFNLQRFPRRKAPGTFRIFCLGGSTTYGRPYTDETSFAGWLRQILPAIDPDRHWEVINAGGISYASYRVANLMDELEGYEPDLFIVYTGHNEFLEERTYSSIRDLPRPVKILSSLVAGTRISTATGAVMRRVGLLAHEEAEPGFVLPEAVAAKLDQSAGLDLYERDDRLRERVLAHYRASLERMVAIAGSAGARLIFVKPASNDRSSSPFKSEHTTGITTEDLAKAEELLEIGRRQNRAESWGQALVALDEALTLDPRFAELHYERGRALLGLGRTPEAKTALERARNEDVCPLRALTEMEKILETVSRTARTPLVDFVDLLERDLERTQGHTILGEEDFLDHVHPTIDGHRRLALALTETMQRLQVLPATATLSTRSLAQITSQVEENVDLEKQAEALASLAWTLDWAGKREDSRRLAIKALESGVDTPRILLIAGKHSALDGNLEQALNLFQRAIRADPLSPTPHYQMGLLGIERGELEEAAAHFSLATVLWPHDAKAHEKLGLVMAERGRYAIAVGSLQEAKRRDSGRASIDGLIERIEQYAGVSFGPIGEPGIEIEKYASGVVHRTKLSWLDPTDGFTRHGIHTEWNKDGSLLRFADTVNGSLLGSDVIWSGSGDTVGPPEGPAN